MSLHHYNESVEQILSEHGIRPTANRMMIVKVLQESSRPLSMMEIESCLESVDKSGISRALAVLRENNLLHVLEDGSDSVRYELCHGHHDDEHSDEHVHFHCEVCGKTFCLEQVHIPSVDYPEGFSVRSVNYMAKGVCPDCAGKNRS